MAEYIKKDDALACFHNWIDSYGEISDPQCMSEYRAIEDLEGIDIEVNCSEIPNGSFVTINDSVDEIKVTNCNHNAEVGKMDLIDRQAAIEAYGEWYVEEGTEEGFIGTVRSLLETLPSAQPEHPFSAVKAELEQTIKELEENGKHHADFVRKSGEFVAEGIRLALIALEEAQLDERKKGKWINHRTDGGHNIADCDQCGNAIQWFDGDEKPRFCCMCGADMRGERDE